MRVIGGSFRSRLLVAPRGDATRPTSDRLRETLFNVLGARVEGASFADLYAGSGAVGIEALSRGASSCVLVERFSGAALALTKNVLTLNLSQQARLLALPVARALRDLAESRTDFDIVFLDPPYEARESYSETIMFLAEHREALLREGAIVVAEHASRIALADSYEELVRYRLLKQGDAALSFYRIRPATVVEAR